MSVSTGPDMASNGTGGVATFEPGDEWRQVPFDEVADGQEFVMLGRRNVNDLRPTWVRVEPMPALPTEPYTVIRVTWREGTWYANHLANPILIRQPKDAHYEWAWSNDSDSFGDDDEVRAKTTDFEVLSEPRAVTAKAVLDHIANEPWARDVDLLHWRGVFGVNA